MLVANWCNSGLLHYQMLFRCIAQKELSFRKPCGNVLPRRTMNKRQSYIYDESVTTWSNINHVSPHIQTKYRLNDLQFTKINMFIRCWHVYATSNKYSGVYRLFNALFAERNMYDVYYHKIIVIIMWLSANYDLAKNLYPLIIIYHISAVTFSSCWTCNQNILAKYD